MKYDMTLVQKSMLLLAHKNSTLMKTLNHTSITLNMWFTFGVRGLIDNCDSWQLINLIRMLAVHTTQLFCQWTQVKPE